VFARRYELPPLFAVVIRQPNGKFRFQVERIPLVDTGDRDADIDAIVASYTAALERCVRTAPAQYFWHHRRWRRQPPDTPEALRDPTR
jgi:KDO2-lipid IV(A) lauroyltransferase